MKLSVVLATYNEDHNLDQCLTSVQGLADEIVISDGGSTDGTLEVAKKFHAKIYHLPNNPVNFHINKNNAIDHATGDWLLQLDADEAVSPELVQEIKSTLSPEHLALSTVNGYWLNRKNWFLTRFLTKGGQYPDPTLRLYKRGFGHLPALDVHEQAVVTGPVGHLHSDLLHYRDTSFDKYLSGFNRYSTIVAAHLADKKIHFNILNCLNYLFIKPFYYFLSLYIRHRGYVDGFPGFVFALFSGLIYPVAYIKYWQHTLHPA